MSLQPLEDRIVVRPGQSEEIDRVCRVHADLSDDAFVAANRARWLS